VTVTTTTKMVRGEDEDGSWCGDGGGGRRDGIRGEDEDVSWCGDGGDRDGNNDNEDGKGRR
jgi:hypothetical protein